MATSKSIYTCTECGGTSPNWLGKCPHCGAWNTLIETAAEPAGGGKNRFQALARSQPVATLSEIEASDFERTPTGQEELDRVLGGGIVSSMTPARPMMRRACASAAWNRAISRLSRTARAACSSVSAPWIATGRTRSSSPRSDAPFMPPPPETSRQPAPRPVASPVRRNGPRVLAPCVTSEGDPKWVAARLRRRLRPSRARAATSPRSPSPAPAPRPPGGTPSLWDPDAVAEVLAAIRARCAVPAGAEVRDAILWDGTALAPGEALEHAIAAGGERVR